MGSNDVMTIYYDEVILRPYHRKYPGGLEQFAADYEEAYTELAAIGETHSDTEKQRKILTNLYDPGDAETKVLVSYCERNCTSFDDIVRHLTDTHVRDVYYTARHSARKAKFSAATITPDEDSDDDDIRTLLKAARDRSKLPDDYKIPPKAWKLLSPEARDTFIAERDKVLEKSDTTGNPPIGKPLPKQYGGAGQDTKDIRQANLGVAVEETASDSEDNDSDTSDEDALMQLIRSYKASRNVSRFLGMTRANQAS